MNVYLNILRFVRILEEWKGTNLRLLLKTIAKTRRKDLRFKIQALELSKDREIFPLKIISPSCAKCDRVEIKIVRRKNRETLLRNRVTPLKESKHWNGKIIYPVIGRIFYWTKERWGERKISRVSRRRRGGRSWKKNRLIDSPEDVSKGVKSWFFLLLLLPEKCFYTVEWKREFYYDLYELWSNRSWFIVRDRCLLRVSKIFISNLLIYTLLSIC